LSRKQQQQIQEFEMFSIFLIDERNVLYRRIYRALKKYQAKKEKTKIDKNNEAIDSGGGGTLKFQTLRFMNF
jgi:hypothetical protein